MNKLKLNPNKTEFLPVGNNDSIANTSLCFLLSFLASKLNLQTLLGILGVICEKISPSTHIYQQCAARAFTICGICGGFAVTLIGIAQNYLQLLWCLVISIIAIHFCMVSINQSIKLR